MEIQKLNPRFLEKIWGTQNLTNYGFETPSDVKIGEIWLISALPKRLSQLKDGKDLKTFFECQNHRFNNFLGEYPLLVKIITPEDYLSVQVHPDDDYALKHHQTLGKPESWYVLEAPQEAHLIYGHKARTKAEIKKLVKEQRWNHLLKKVPVRKGDFIYVPPGKIHAVTPGVIVCEIQRSSDITYRFYDFDRVDKNNQKRPLHILESLDVVTVPDCDLPIINKSSGILINNSNFAIYLWDVAEEPILDLSLFRPYWLQIVVISGSGAINSETFHRGEAAITLDKIAPLWGSGDLKVLISWVSQP